jgi:cell division transport system ATP-binding protein
MLALDNVSKQYPSGHSALKRVSFELSAGKMAFLTGHSGAGKSTLLKLIMQIEKPSSGQIIFNNINITRLSRRRAHALRRSVGMIFQNPQLISNRDVFFNVALPLVLDGFRDAELKRRVHGALDRVGLRSKLKCRPAELSTGEQQRVGIARAIVSRPKLLLADEPTGNLDPVLSLEIIKLFAEFRQLGSTVLIATHDLTLIASMPYQIFSLRNGELYGAAHAE